METAIAPPKREIFCEDAITWLEHRMPLPKSSLVTSLPDISEFPNYTLDQWKDWFVKTAALVLTRTPDDGVTVFYQSDIKIDGTWVDKGYLAQKAAEACGHALLWHKIVSRVDPGQATFGRPGYSHMLCFSKSARADISKSSPDVLPELGDKTWERGMGLEACVLIAKFIAEQTASTTLINPFCGQGSMLAAANAFGLNAIGIERSAKRAELARRLQIDVRAKSWVNDAPSP